MRAGEPVEGSTVLDLTGDDGVEVVRQGRGDLSWM